MTTWNKFCFTGGIFEASVQLPGTNNIVGLWPAIWAMGNLGGNSHALRNLKPIIPDAPAMVPHSRVWLANGISVRSFVADCIPVALHLRCL